jgi:hypothetical protein
MLDSIAPAIISNMPAAAGRGGRGAGAGRWVRSAGGRAAGRGADAELPISMVEASRRSISMVEMLVDPAIAILL